MEHQQIRSTCSVLLFGMVFSRMIGLTTSAVFSSCGMSPSSSDDSSYCTGRPDGLNVYPGSCSCFYQCSNGGTYVIHCAPGDIYFDPDHPAIECHDWNELTCERRQQCGLSLAGCQSATTVSVRTTPSLTAAITPPTPAEIRQPVTSSSEQLVNDTRTSELPVELLTESQATMFTPSENVTRSIETSTPLNATLVTSETRLSNPAENRTALVNIFTELTTERPESTSQGSIHISDESVETSMTTSLLYSSNMNSSEGYAKYSAASDKNTEVTSGVLESPTENVTPLVGAEWREDYANRSTDIATAYSPNSTISPELVTGSAEYSAGSEIIREVTSGGLERPIKRVTPLVSPEWQEEYATRSTEIAPAHSTSYMIPSSLFAGSTNYSTGLEINMEVTSGGQQPPTEHVTPLVSPEWQEEYTTRSTEIAPAHSTSYTIPSGQFAGSTNYSTWSEINMEVTTGGWQQPPTEHVTPLVSPEWQEEYATRSTEIAPAHSTSYMIPSSLFAGSTNYSAGSEINMEVTSGGQQPPSEHVTPLVSPAWQEEYSTRPNEVANASSTSAKLSDLVTGSASYSAGSEINREVTSLGLEPPTEFSTPQISPERQEEYPTHSTEIATAQSTNSIISSEVGLVTGSTNSAGSEMNMGVTSGAPEAPTDLVTPLVSPEWREEYATRSTEIATAYSTSLKSYDLVTGSANYSAVSEINREVTSLGLEPPTEFFTPPLSPERQEEYPTRSTEIATAHSTISMISSEVVRGSTDSAGSEINMEVTSGELEGVKATDLVTPLVSPGWRGEYATRSTEIATASSTSVESSDLVTGSANHSAGPDNNTEVTSEGLDSKTEHATRSFVTFTESVSKSIETSTESTPYYINYVEVTELFTHPTENSSESVSKSIELSTESTPYYINYVEVTELLTHTTENSSELEKNAELTTGRLQSSTENITLLVEPEDYVIKSTKTSTIHEPVTTRLARKTSSTRPRPTTMPTPSQLGPRPGQVWHRPRPISTTRPRPRVRPTARARPRPRPRPRARSAN